MNFRSQLKSLFRKEKLDAEMAEEMRAHLEAQTEMNLARGMPPDEARYAARREFGGVEQMKESARDQRAGAGLERLWRDVRFAGRGFLRRPGFAAVAIGTLALGIGATSAIFSVVEAFLLRPLPYARPEQLVSVQPEMPGSGRLNVGMSVPEFEDLRDQAGVFEDLSIVWPMNGNLTGVEQPQRIEAMAVSGSYFRLLGATPALGRVFGAEEEKTTAWAEGCVLSYLAWQRHFGGDPDVLGRKIWLDYDTYRVIGVMPPEFKHPGRTLTTDVEIWLASGLRSTPFPAVPKRTLRNIPGVVGRIRGEFTVTEAAARLANFASGLTRQFPSDYPVEKPWRVKLQPLQAQLIAEARPVLWLLLAAVGVVLLICCATLANLMLVRASSRRQEFAVRCALGASRGAVVRQLLVESLLLALLGGAAGLVLAWILPPLIVQLAPMSLPRVNVPTLNGAVLGFTFGVACVTGILFGLVPAFAESKINLVAGLKARDGGAAGSRLRAFFVVGQVALSLVLLASGGLLVKSFWRVLRVDPGFESEGVVAARIWLPPPNDPKAPQSYRQPAQRTAFFREIARRLRALPGVRDVAIGTGQSIPLASGWNTTTFVVEGAAASGEAAPTALFSTVSPAYFRVLGIRLRAGRGFEETDDGGNRVAVVNRAAAERFWAGGDPIGRQITLGEGANAQRCTIVGVVENVKNQALEAPDTPQIYLSVYQRSAMGVTVFLQTAAGAATLLEPIRRELQAIDRDLPIYAVQPLTDIVARSLAPRRFAMVLVAAFSVVALGLAALGIYGVLALMVAQRTREIGVRVAIGASRSQILGLILRRGAVLTAYGIAAGLFGAFATTHVLGNLLFETSAVDAVTFGAIVFVLAGVAMLASWLPARRATKIDPMVALRCE